ncbi:hypothetical protein HPB50_001398 [Hyalomma asiaticum]|uniref:Uncharacterized protein n=1 Tax=Hyalomma asiaticum TaxID=266040 RepID=A0ACB7RQD0_HYAAI|nr:hypothetical protein HPB50_001398 [Hyalomma asiaticum]
MEGSGDVRLPAKVKPSTWPPVRAQQQRESSITSGRSRRSLNQQGTTTASHTDNNGALHVPNSVEESSGPAGLDPKRKATPFGNEPGRPSYT